MSDLEGIRARVAEAPPQSRRSRRSPAQAAPCRWVRSGRFDRAALPLADRHYNRQKPGSPQFVPPGRCLVLLAEDRKALWVTSWPRFALHAWSGAWVNSLFRNEGGGVASEMIRAAVAHSLWHWGTAPDLGIITFVDPTKVRSTNPGYCYLRAGFTHEGWTAKGLRVLRMPPGAMPEAEPPYDPQGRFELEVGA